MSRNVAQYSVTVGLSGMYMPDSHYGAFQFDTRRELIEFAKSEIEAQDFPKSAIRQIKWIRLWQFIKRNGSSVAHFSIDHNGREIAFHGLTHAEFAAMQEES